MAADSRTADRQSSVPLDSPGEAMSDSGGHGHASSAMRSSACTAVHTPAPAIPQTRSLHSSKRPSNPSSPATRSNSPFLDEFASGNYTYFASAHDDESPDDVATGWNRNHLAIGRGLDPSSSVPVPISSDDKVASFGSQFASNEALQAQPGQIDEDREDGPIPSHSVLHRDSGFAGSRSSTFQTATHSLLQRRSTQQSVQFSDNDSGFGDSRTSTFHESCQPAIPMSRPAFHRSSIPSTRAETMRNPAIARRRSFTFRAPLMSGQPVPLHQSRRSSFHTVRTATQEIGRPGLEKPLLFSRATATKQQVQQEQQQHHHQPTDPQFDTKPVQFENCIVSLAERDELLKLGRQAFQIPLRLRAYEVNLSIQECNQKFLLEPISTAKTGPLDTPKSAVELQESNLHPQREEPASNTPVHDALILKKAQDPSISTTVPIHSVPAYRGSSGTGAGNGGGNSGWAGASSNQGSSAGQSSSQGSPPGGHQGKGRGKGNGPGGSPEDPPGKGGADGNPGSQCIFCDVGLKRTNQHCWGLKDAISKWRTHLNKCHGFHYCLDCATAFRTEPATHNCREICLEESCSDENFGKRTAEQHHRCFHKKTKNSQEAKRQALGILAVLTFEPRSQHYRGEEVPFDYYEYQRLLRLNDGQPRFPIANRNVPSEHQPGIRESQHVSPTPSEQSHPPRAGPLTAIVTDQVTDVPNALRLENPLFPSITAVKNLLHILKALSEYPNLPDEAITELADIPSSVRLMVRPITRILEQQRQQAETRSSQELRVSSIPGQALQNAETCWSFPGDPSTQAAPDELYAILTEHIDYFALQAPSGSHQSAAALEPAISGPSMPRPHPQPPIGAPQHPEYNNFDDFSQSTESILPQLNPGNLPPVTPSSLPLNPDQRRNYAANPNFDYMGENLTYPGQPHRGEQSSADLDLFNLVNSPESSEALTDHPHLSNAAPNPPLYPQGSASNSHPAQDGSVNPASIQNQTSGGRAPSRAQGPPYRGKGKHRQEPYRRG